MAKGKAGPKPVTKEEIAEQEAANIISPETTPDEATDNIIEDQRQPLVPQVAECDDCAFQGTYEEWMEHSNGTGHTGYELVDIEPEQLELIETEGIVKRQVTAPRSPEIVSELHLNMQRVVRSILNIEDEKKEFDALCNEKLKPLKEELRGLSRQLERDTETILVDCEWRVSTEENARVLVRLDNGDIVERKPLTEEDRAAELAKVNAENQQAEEAAV